MKKIFYFKEHESLDELVYYLLSFKDLEAILLNGELGAGKTTLTASIAKKLNEKKTVVSPTFNTMICYDKIIHIDAYKLKGDLFAYEEYFENKLVIIEWAKNITHNFRNYFSINVTLQEKNGEVFHVFEIIENTCRQGLFIETSLEDFFVALIENNKIIDYILIEKLVKKTDLFFEEIDKLLQKNNTKLTYMSEIFTTIGPGSFTGSRLGFAFASTNKQLQKIVANNDISIKIAPTYDLFFTQTQKDLVYIKANKYKAYEVSKTNDKIIINLSDKVDLIDKFDYSNFMKNVDKFLSQFKEVENVLDIELIYASDPQIGAI